MLDTRDDPAQGLDHVDREDQIVPVRQPLDPLRDLAEARTAVLPHDGRQPPLDGIGRDVLSELIARAGDDAGPDAEPRGEPIGRGHRQLAHGERLDPARAARRLGERRKIEPDETRRHRRDLVERAAEHERARVGIEELADPLAQRGILGELLDRHAREPAAERDLAQRATQALHRIAAAQELDRREGPPGTLRERRGERAAPCPAPSAQHDPDRCSLGCRRGERREHRRESRARRDDLRERPIRRARDAP